MKSYGPRPNSGVLFPARKGSSDRAPDFTGTLDLGEELLDAIRRSTSSTVKVRLAGWKKTSDKVGVYLSIAVSADDDNWKSKKPQGSGRPQQSRKSSDDDDSTPW